MKTIEEMKKTFSTCTQELVDAASIEKFEFYRKLTDYGQQLEAFPAENRIEKNFVYGCISNVYISAEIKDGCIYFQGCSDALTIRGYVYVFVHAFSGMNIHDFLESSSKEVEQFARLTKTSSFLTPSRSNALGNVYTLMQKHAQSLLADQTKQIK